MAKPIIIKGHIDQENIKIVDFLHQKTGLSKQKIKTAMTFGGFWIVIKSKLQRQRRATQVFQKGTQFAFYYQENLYAPLPRLPECLWEEKDWGIWVKPAGVVAQGSPYGDRSTLLSFVADSRRGAFPVHRLDREVQGLIVVAYTSSKAAYFSQKMAKSEIVKHYEALVQGNVAVKLGLKGEITEPLDGKASCTRFYILSQNKHDCRLRLEIPTGRFHQIRRHLSHVGHPIIGDERYGGPASKDGTLHLMAVNLTVPSMGGTRSFALPESWRLF